MRILLLIFALLLFTVIAYSQNPPPIEDVAVVSKLAEPKYPSGVEETGVAGTITVRVAVDEAGNVTSATLMSGPGWVCPSVTNPTVNLARQSAKDAALKTKFQPMPHPGTAVLRFKFGKQLSDDKARKLERYNIDPPLTPLGTPSASGSDAKTNKVFGTVNVQLIIDVDGSVMSAEPLDGLPALQHSARIKACEAHFSPTLRNGQPVRVTGTIKYNFVP